MVRRLDYWSVGSNKNASTRQIGSVTTMHIGGRIVLGETVRLRRLVYELLDKGHRQIILNLADVGWIDSAGLGLPGMHTK